MTPIMREFVNSALVRAGIVFPRSSTCACSTKTTVINAPENQWQGNAISSKPQGQPTSKTHPHLLKDGELIPGITVGEFQERRHRLMNNVYKHASRHNMKSHHLVIIPSATKVYMTEKIPYVFRQNSDFLYLSGCLQPDSALVLSGHDESFSSTLFLRKPDAHAELWDGPSTDLREAPCIFGVDQALPVGEMKSFLNSFAHTNRGFTLWYDFMQPIQPEIHRTLRDFLAETWNKMWESPKPLVHKMRLYKSPAEIGLMKASCDIASNAISKTIQYSHDGITEHQLFACVDYECRVRGAQHLAYPPVVAGGSRANIIHYINNNQVVHSGQMVLMDAGCELHGYCSDITRTWPVCGQFSSTQRALYDVVLLVQTELLAILEKGFPSLDDLFHNMCILLGKYLQELGVLSSKLGNNELLKAAYSFCPHHVSHYLGMDVHDTALIPRSIKLEPGMVITVEPG
ncbi:Putative Xaa-Pro aminopeptidase 3 [Gryllus bimaculatus]|nr:Putative Xaa-Pro aminopeptidase 3 [Gryllus bimaculatus]